MCLPKIIYLLADWSDIRAGLKSPDFKRDTLKEVAESIVEYGYIPMPEEDAQLLNSSDAVAHFKIPNTDCSLIKEKK